MKALLLVLAFWLGVGGVVNWALTTAYLVDREEWLRLGVMLFIPVIALSIFLWFAFRELLR